MNSNTFFKVSDRFRLFLLHLLIGRKIRLMSLTIAISMRYAPMPIDIAQAV